MSQRYQKSIQTPLAFSNVATTARNAKDSIVDEPTKRLEKSQKNFRKGNSPLIAIRNRCIDCCGYQINEVKLCADTTCPLHPWRFGKRPATVAGVKRERSEKQKAAAEKLGQMQRSKP